MYKKKIKKYFGFSNKYGNKESQTESFVCFSSVTSFTPLNNCLTFLSVPTKTSRILKGKRNEAVIWGCRTKCNANPTYRRFS